MITSYYMFSIITVMAEVGYIRVNPVLHIRKTHDILMEYECNWKRTADYVFSHYKNSIPVPSQAPTSFSVTAKSSTSVEASWQLPPADSWNGNITGFMLFYKRKGSSGSSTQLAINSASAQTKVVTGLDKYTEYEFQVSAFTSVGDGPNSTVKSVSTDSKWKKKFRTDLFYVKPRYFY